MIRYTGVVRFIDEGPAQIVTTTADEILGRPTNSFAKFAEDHKAAFTRETVNA